MNLLYKFDSTITRPCLFYVLRRYITTFSEIKKLHVHGINSLNGYGLMLFVFSGAVAMSTQNGFAKIIYGRLSNCLRCPILGLFNW